MNVKGESFNTETPWDKVEAIIEKKSMFLIKQGKIKYGYLMKSYFNQEQLKDFKDIIQAINIKKN
jgi:putative heme iron utilization protein